MTIARPKRLAAPLGGSLLVLLALVGCGSGEDAPGPGAESEPVAATERATASERPAATLAIGGQTWTFDRVLCAFGDDTGQDDISFSLSARQEGRQLDAQISERFGHTIDVSPLRGDGSDAWNAGEAGAGAENFIQIDADRVTAGATFTNSATGETAEGTLTADCP